MPTITPLIFTRLLYPKDEVIHSIWYCFENKTSYEETLFWCYELYMSGFEEDTLQILYTLYFCYVSFHDNELLKKLDTIYLQWSLETSNEEKATYVNTFLESIYNHKYSNMVKQLLDEYEQTSKHGKVTLFKGKKPKWLEEYDLSVRSLLHSISKQKIQNICHFLKIKEENESELEKIEINVCQYANSQNKEYLTSKHVQGTTIVIIANMYTLLHQHHIEQTKENTRHFTRHFTQHFDSLTEEKETLSDYISTFEEYYPSYVYKILREQRAYKTRIENIDKSHLSLEQTNKTWQQCYYDDWLYYASFSPLWKNRIETYEGIIDHKNHKVDFDDLETYKDDNTRFEEFYNHYNLEPDEQYSNTFIS
jgi:hypothetical protein